MALLKRAMDTLDQKGDEESKRTTDGLREMSRARLSTHFQNIVLAACRYEHAENGIPTSARQKCLVPSEHANKETTIRKHKRKLMINFNPTLPAYFKTRMRTDLLTQASSGAFVCFRLRLPDLYPK